MTATMKQVKVGMMKQAKAQQARMRWELWALATVILLAIEIVARI